jgi:signal transduction histidine kinase
VQCGGHEKYRRLFETTAVSLWEMDLSAVKLAVNDLKLQGVDDIRSYLKDHPQFVRQTLGGVKITDINAATLKLFRAKNKPDFFESIDKLLTPQLLAVFSECLVAIHQERAHFVGEVTSRKLTGGEVNFQVHIEFPPESQNFDSVIANVLDITERKRLEVQFLNAQKMEAIGTLAGGIAHDFNNLLMAIEGLATFMLQDTGADHPHYTILQSIENQVRNGAKLTAQLLGYAHKDRPKSTHVDLNQVVRETAEAFGRARKQIAVTVDLGQDLDTVKADPGQIEQVLLNLCVNAADAMPEGGRLTLRTANTTHKRIRRSLTALSPGDYVQLTVRDTGAGMDEETRNRIFEPFFTTKAMGRGTGLGLVSVSGIVNGLGGVIDVETEIEHGTIFRIFLPASRRASRKIVPAEESQPAVSKSQTVLLVDDEEVVLDVGTRMLQRIGLTVLPAGNGQEALRVYTENIDRIDLVILDMVMPDMGGKAVFERLKQLNSEVKVLLATGYSLNDEAARIMRNGCDGFIQKPYNMQQLTARIDQILQ